MTELSDVLAQHLRRCEEGLKKKELLTTNVSTKRVRVQRACHQCARSKSKCDFQHPCARCIRRSTDCVYNRERYHENGGIYTVVDPVLPAAVSGTTPASVTESFYPHTTEDESTEASEISSTNFNDMPLGELNDGSNWTDQPQQQFLAASTALATNAGVPNTQPLLDRQTILGLDEEYVSMDFDFSRLQDSTSVLNAVSLYYDMTGPFESVDHPATDTMTSRGGLLLTLLLRLEDGLLNGYRAWSGSTKSTARPMA